MTSLPLREKFSLTSKSSCFSQSLIVVLSYAHTPTHTHTHTHTHTLLPIMYQLLEMEGILLMVLEKERGEEYHLISKLTLVYDFHLIDQEISRRHLNIKCLSSVKLENDMKNNSCERQWFLTKLNILLPYDPAIMLQRR